MYYKPKTTRPQVCALPFLIHGEIFHFKPYLNGYNLTQVNQNQFLTGLRHFLKKILCLYAIKKASNGKTWAAHWDLFLDSETNIWNI